MTGSRETDRPLSEIAEAAINFYGSGDHADKDVGCGCGADAAMTLMRTQFGRDAKISHLDDCDVLVEYWSDEDKKAVEEIAAELEGYVMAGMLKLGWREG